MALGYINNEEETRKYFDKDGYFHTGDIVEQYEGGRIR
jgi:long-subunit acyl-CoA synthetase (AMP-forming)